MKQPWDVDSYFKIVSAPTGVFLTVYPPVGEGNPVSAAEIIEQLKEKGVQHVNSHAVENAVNRQSGTAILVGEYFEQAAADELFVVSIDKDGQTAYLTILVPVKGGKEIAMKDILRKLKQEGVVFGISTDTIFDVLKHKRFNEDILVASGNPPVPGKDAFLEFKFPTTKVTSMVKKLEDGRVDFKNLNLIASVKEGDTLVVKHQAVKGIPGTMVTGMEISARDGNDVPLPVGKNTVVSPDGLELRASVPGMVYLNPRGKVEIEQVHVVTGDVDYSTGNINFHSELVIDGSVMDGFIVHADKDITIKGNVWKATVTSGGNITIKGGILGKNIGYISANGNVTAKFAEYCRIKAQKDVLIGESIVSSQIDAVGKVVLTGRRGVLIGGKIRAGEEVSAKIIGSRVDTPTIIEVGVNPAIREEMKDLSEELTDEKYKFHGIKLEIKGLLALKEKMGHDFSADKEELLASYLGAQNLLIEKLRDASESITLLHHEITTVGGGRVLVSGIIYPGVKISIRAANMYIREEYKYVCLTAKGDAIEIIPYDLALAMQKKKKVL
ncbi:MAG: FapA family protein [bacterium]|nr:FapA family protein [bacterium]